MSLHRRIVDRRRFLTALGLGAGSLCLPSLRLPEARAQIDVPTRLLLYITPHGTVPGRWHMRQPGRDQEDYDFSLSGYSEGQFSDILRPLHRHRESITIVDGLARAVTYAEEYRVAEEGQSGDINRHHIAQAHLLTNTWAYQQASTARGGARSIDQEIGDAVGQPGRWNSRVYGFNHQHAYNYVGANQPAPREQNANTAFADILGLAPEPTDPNAPPSRADLIRAARPSALDMAREEFASVLPKLNAADREKLERHRVLVRDLEIGLSSPPSVTGCDPTFSAEGHIIDQFSRISTIALACDLTRVITLVTQNIPSPEFGVDPSIDMHQDIAHASDERTGTTAGIEGMVNYNRVYAEHFAYLLDQLAAVQEGEAGSLLDHTAAVWLAELATGGHDLQRTPVVVAGGASGYFRPGRYVHYAQTNRVNAAWGNTHDIGFAQERLFVNLMHAMGLTARQSFGLSQVQFGSTTIPLSGPLPRLT